MKGFLSKLLKTQNKEKSLANHSFCCDVSNRTLKTLVKTELQMFFCSIRRALLSYHFGRTQLRIHCVSTNSPWYYLCVDIMSGHKTLSRFRTGHGKPGKSWNLRISFSRPGKSWNSIFSHGRSWKIKVLFDRLVTAKPKVGENLKRPWNMKMNDCYLQLFNGKTYISQ